MNVMTCFFFYPFISARSIFTLTNLLLQEFEDRGGDDDNGELQEECFCLTILFSMTCRLQIYYYSLLLMTKTV